MRSRPRHRTATGFTLLELLISTVLVAIVLAAVMTAFLAQNKLYRGLESGRQTEDNARMALQQMASLVHMAGAGISPAFAFDMDWYQCPAPHPGCRDNVVSQPWAAGAAPTNLNLRAGTDELVFYARSSHTYVPPTSADAPGLLGDVWDVATGSSSTSLMLQGHAADKTTIPGNAVLLVACPSAFTFLYATTAITPVTVPQGSSASVSLLGDSTASPFRQNTTANMQAPCIQGGLAKAYLVNRYRFFVANDPTTGRPFLYLDRGINTSAGNNTIDPPEPVAADVEDLQVAYITRSAQVDGAANSPNTLSFYDAGNWGSAPAPLEGTCTSINECSTCAKSNCPISYSSTSKCCPQSCSSDLAITSPQGFYQKSALFPCPIDSPQRQANVPGNVVQVRITVVTRTSRPAMTNGVVNTSAGDNPANFSAENHTRSNGTDGYGRARLSITVDIPNTSADGIPLI